MQGPGISAGRRSDLPSGTIDIAPTVLAALGLATPDSMTGRVLTEAFAARSGVPSVSDVERWDERSPAGTLSWSAYAGHRYLGAARR
jgi:arylsulfatase A-like enzyme